MQDLKLAILLSALAIDGLEWKDDIGDLIRFAVPQQLHLAGVIEKHKAVFRRKRFAGFDIADEVTFVVIG